MVTDLHITVRGRAEDDEVEGMQQLVGRVIKQEIMDLLHGHPGVTAMATVTSYGPEEYAPPLSMF